MQLTDKRIFFLKNTTEKGIFRLKRVLLKYENRIERIIHFWSENNRLKKQRPDTFNATTVLLKKGNWKDVRKWVSLQKKAANAQWKHVSDESKGNVKIQLEKKFIGKGKIESYGK